MVSLSEIWDLVDSLALLQRQPNDETLRVLLTETAFDFHLIWTSGRWWLLHSSIYEVHWHQSLNIHSTYLSLVSTARVTWGRKDFFFLTHYSPSSGEAKVRTQGRNLEAGTKALAMEKCCLTGLFLLDCLVCFLIYARIICPEIVPPIVGLDTHIKKRHCPTGLPMSQSDRSIFSVKVSLFR